MKVKRHSTLRSEMMIRRIQVLLVILVLTGCSTILEVGIELTPTPNGAPAATMTAMASEISRLATRAAAEVTPIPPVPPSLGRVAYVQGGDIWIKTLPAAVPQRRTTDGHNSEPRWSPSGQWLAFRTERQVILQQNTPCDIPRPRTQTCLEDAPVLQKQVWVVEADGNSLHPLSQGTSIDAFAWSPVDDRLAYSTARGGLSTINADGTDLVALVPQAAGDRNSSGSVGRFAWSPDGASIVYEWQVRSLTQTLVYQGLWEISIGQERVELYASDLSKKGVALLAGWSPQGRRVLFWQSEAASTSMADGVPLYSIDADRDQSLGNVPVQLEIEGLMLSHSDFIAPAPRGASSTSRDMVALVVGSSRSTWKNKRIELAGRIISPKSLAAISPAWSPDGKRLAFVAAPDRADLGGGETVRQELMQRRIWVTNTVGEPQPQRLTDGTIFREERPLWSADCGHILFARIDAKGRASLWLMAVDGDAARQVVDELTPAPDPIVSYGHIDWEGWFDWWRG